MITDFGAELDGSADALPTAAPGRSPASSACELYRETIGVVIETPAGEECHVDCGDGPMVRDHDHHWDHDRNRDFAQ